MRYILTLVVFGIALSTAYQAEGKIDPDTVVGVWLFDRDPKEGVTDSSGNGHDGEVAGNVNWVQGKFGKALEFPGVSGSMVRVPPKPELDLMTFTIVVWYKGETTGSWQYLVSKEIPHNSRNYSLGVQKDTDVIMAQITVGPEQWKTATGRTVLTDGDWHHMAATYDGTLIKAWVDGVMEGQTGEQGEPDHPEDQPLTIGAVNGIPVKGVVDDVALFSVALEEDDIKEIMTDGLEKTLGIVVVELAGKLAITWGGIKDCN
jgi:hypothetical protein